MKKSLPILISILILSCQNEPKVNIQKIKFELDSIMVLDQKHRNELNSLYLEFGLESSEFQEVFVKQHLIDSMNVIYVESLIKKLGKYPGNSLLGHSTGKVAFFVLQHSSEEIQLKYLDLILEAAESNELDKGSAAMYHDRCLMYKGEPQIYGTQIRSREFLDSLIGENKREFYLHPIKDTVKIDSVRMWNGLIPLEEYLISFGLSRWN
ncbi:DUF6624 domain-containing protein [Catalinimonas sp. 4WD22]|uniref:DUF6624 domain-containing protein n=1 Tax=Catalinimonas locisalis TaxID=3133978 RepID=UPI0031018C1D